MSTPVRGADGPLGYAPRWARTTGSGRGDTASDTRVRGSAPVQELPQDLRPPRIAMPPPETSPWDAASPDAPLESSGGASDEPAPHRDTKLSRTPLTAQAPEPNWKRKKRAAVFEGDAALRELRSRLASAPDQTPEPPLYQTRTPIFAAVVRLLGVMVLAAAGALGFLWITGPRGAPPQVAGKAGSGDVAFASASYRGLEAAPQRPAAVENAAAPNAQPSGRTSFAVANTTEGGSTPQSALVPRTPAAPPQAPHVTAPPVPRVTAPPPVPRVTAPPAVAAPPPAVAAPPPAVAAPPPAVAAPALAVAAPAPAVAAPLPAAAASPPVVAMTSPATVTPSPAVQVPASRTVAVPSPPTSMAAAPDWDEIADLLGRARTYLSSGDVAAARLVLRRAAERNDPQAALALGGTYDPTVLQRLGIVSFQADAARAREWYRRAKELGSADASLRLAQLVQTDR